jgi:hypothetical protein
MTYSLLEYKIVTNDIRHASLAKKHGDSRFGTSDVIHKITKLKQTSLISDKDTDQSRGTYGLDSVYKLSTSSTPSQSCTCGLDQHRI